MLSVKLIKTRELNLGQCLSIVLNVVTVTRVFPYRVISSTDGDVMTPASRRSIGPTVFKRASLKSLLIIAFNRSGVS